MGPLELKTELPRSDAASADSSVTEGQQTERATPETGFSVAVAQATESPGPDFMGNRTPEARTIARPENRGRVPVRHSTDWMAAVAGDRAVAGLLGVETLDVPTGRGRGPGHTARVRHFSGAELNGWYANLGHTQPGEVLAVIAIVNALAPRIANSQNGMPTTVAEKRAFLQQVQHIARSPEGPVVLPDPEVLEIYAQWYGGGEMTEDQVQFILERMGGDTPENRAALAEIHAFLATGLTASDKETVEASINAIIPPYESPDEEEHLAGRDETGVSYDRTRSDSDDGVDWLADSSMTAYKRYQQSGEADLDDARDFAEAVAEERRAMSEFEVSREAGGAPKNRGPA